MNFRIDLPIDEVRELIINRNYDELLRNDQLTKEIQRGDNPILKNFKEKKIDFDPTYKYSDNSQEYDSTKKIRIPAYCDRILFNRDKKYKKMLVEDPFSGNDKEASTPFEYCRRETLFSDHRPVHAIVKVHVIKIDEEKKEQVRQRIIDSGYTITESAF